MGQVEPRNDGQGDDKGQDVERQARRALHRSQESVVGRSPVGRHELEIDGHRDGYVGDVGHEGEAQPEPDGELDAAGRDLEQLSVQQEDGGAGEGLAERGEEGQAEL